MSEYKWIKELTAWAQGKCVQVRGVYHDGSPRTKWQTLGKDSKLWVLSDAKDQEYRIYELEIGSYYKVKFATETVVARFLAGAKFWWVNESGSVSCILANSEYITPVTPEDKVEI